MKLAVSSIAWTNEEDEVVALKLKELGVRYIELAPTKHWENPTKAPLKAVRAHREFWADHGIEVVAFQSMLFSRPDLKVFDNEANREEGVLYLKDFIRLANEFGARVMVYGSPKNRQKGDLPLNEAMTIATNYFKQVGDYAAAKNVQFCIEPNPVDYACDFITNAADGLAFVKKVDSPGFGLHLDIAGMTLAGDPIAESIKNTAPFLRHFHISSPQLGPVEPDTSVNHLEAAEALKSVNYDGFVSIEMRPGELGTNVKRVETAVRFAQSIYN